VPTIAEGPHREQLKQQLLEQTQSPQPRSLKMRLSTFSRMPPLLKVSAALLATAILVGTGWAAEKIYMKWNGISLTLGTTEYEQSGNVSLDPQKVVEAARRHHEEDNKLIAEKKFKFVKAFELFSQKRYVYTFTYADGSQTKTTVQIPLETVTSWDDYEQKKNEQAEKIAKAVAAGNFRLIDVNTIDSWTCRDVDSNEKLNVRRIFNPGGQDNAKVTLQAAKEPKQMQEMSWKEHLKTIRDGKRELLGVKNDTIYTYEAVLDDGSKATFIRDHPLKKLQK
jgi:hypothetical protein